MKLPTKEEQTLLANLQKELESNSYKNVLSRNAALAAKVELAQTEWEKEVRNSLSGKTKDIWTVRVPGSMKSSGGQKFAALDDGSVITSGQNPAKDNYTLQIEGSGIVTAIRLEALRHESFPRKSLSRSNGNFILSGFRVSQGSKKNLKVASAIADYEQKSWPVAATLDGKNQTGWAVDGHNDKAGDRSALFTLARPVDLGAKGSLTVELQHQAGHSGHNIGRFRISFTDSLNPSINGKSDIPKEVVTSLRKQQRSPSEVEIVANYFQSKTPLLAEYSARQNEIKKKIDSVNQGIKTMLVSESLATPRVTRLLHRGDWLDKDGEIVEPTLPAFLPRNNDLPKDRRANRLDLAKWIVEPVNPLTARAFVNRVWMLFFGEGISRNVEDLGGQGEPPTHPELLDHLALEFQSGGWDVKALIKEILLSDTYRQVSTVSDDLLAKDPVNRLWARQGRWRIEAEFVRDTALQLGNLLVNRQGGKSVKPYQPEGYWQHLNFPRRKWEAGKGDDLYRRGLYTFRCRSFPHPAMVSFDAPAREECTSQRTRSNIPQQALVLLNDPVFVEAARNFGYRIARVPGGRSAKIQFGWKEATGREPVPEEVEVLEALYEAQRHKYLSAEEQASEFLSIGNSPGEKLIALSDSVAWTQVARAILNAYETTSRN
ncbi:MAG: DUF1553 domain-containing protein [Verrucomicrobiales bacterium]|nr:DUF1553 domain-containing protein [Verrucomicrobiales bacterium]